MTGGRLSATKLWYSRIIDKINGDKQPMYIAYEIKYLGASARLLRQMSPCTVKWNVLNRILLDYYSCLTTPIALEQESKGIAAIIGRAASRFAQL